MTQFSLDGQQSDGGHFVNIGSGAVIHKVSDVEGKAVILGNSNFEDRCCLYSGH